MNAYVTPEMTAAVGRPFRVLVSHPVSESDIRRWAIAVYFPERPPQRFRRVTDLTAPEDFNPFAWTCAQIEEVAGVDPLDPGATEKRLGIAGPALVNQLNGGLTVEYGAAIRPGDVITAESTVAGYREREGRHGVMLFTGLLDRWTNQRGEFVRSLQMDLIRY